MKYALYKATGKVDAAADLPPIAEPVCAKCREPLLREGSDFRHRDDAPRAACEAAAAELDGRYAEELFADLSRSMPSRRPDRSHHCDESTETRDRWRHRLNEIVKYDTVERLPRMRFSIGE